MKKIGTYLLIICLVVGCLAGCGSKPAATPTTATPTTTAAPETTAPTQSAPQELDVREDHYWVAETYYSEDGQGAEGPHPLDPQAWFIDLTMGADGTARFRDVLETVCLMDDSYMDLTWEKSQDGHFLFYSKLYAQPVLDGVYENGILTVEYRAMTLTMKEYPAPEKEQESLPAELVGTWLMTYAETEGYQWPIISERVSSLIFQVAANNGPMELRADREERNTDGLWVDGDHGLEVTILNHPLYEGCGNDSWSVRIGPESPKDANGYPTETEYYATLLDYNTLLMQQYYTVDGSPAVSTLTYWRFPEIVTWFSPDYTQLDESNWICTDYINSQGEYRSPPDEMVDFSLILFADQTCVAYYGDVAVRGSWQLENGGVIILQGEDGAFWFAGTISAYSVETTYEVSDTYEMALYYQEGILRLRMTGFG